MKLNTLIQTTAITAALTISSFAAEGWMTDFEAAKKKAAAENKSLLVDFTGSDWCHWCVKLQEEVFSKPGFKGSDKFILVELDFPRDKSKQSMAIQKQNELLMSKYGVQGFPTILLLDSKGRPFAKTGYARGGPEAYNKHLDTLLVQKTNRDKAFAAAALIEDKVEKSKALSASLEAMQGVSPTQYPEVLTTILDGDPLNKTANLALLDSALAKVETAEQKAEAFGKIDSTVAKLQLEGLEKQELLTKKLDILFQTGDIKGMGPVIDTIVKVSPESKIGKMLTKFKTTRYPDLLKKAQPKK